MIDFDITDLLLAVLSLLLAFSTFWKKTGKDNKQDGERSGVVSTELSNIKTLLVEVRDETRDIRQSVGDHGERIARCEEKLEASLVRIRRIEKQLDISHE